jgi:hypothetical protein
MIELEPRSQAATCGRTGVYGDAPCRGLWLFLLKVGPARGTMLETLCSKHLGREESSTASSPWPH